MATILVIEDEPDFRQFVMAILKHQRHQTTQTASLRERPALARRDAPDLVLLASLKVFACCQRTSQDYFPAAHCEQVAW